MELYVPFFQYPRLTEFEDVESWRVVCPDHAMKTGDILIFSASGILSSAIKAFSATNWNHIGMVCWVELTKHDGSTEIDLFCFELGSEVYTDLMTMKGSDKAVRLVRLADISHMYDLIALRRLNFTRTSQFCDRFQDFMLKWKGTPFPSTFNLLKTHFLSGPFPDDNVTCSQLAAEMLRELDIYEPKFDTSQVEPSHFSSESKAFPDYIFDGEEVVVFKNNAWLKKRIIYVVTIVLILTLILVLIFLKLRR